MDDHVLDSPVWTALTGPHARFAESHGLAARYRDEFTVFAALAPGANGRAWADLAALAGPGARVGLAGTGLVPPAGWEVVWQADGVQLVDAGVATADDPSVVPLTPADVPDMLDLVARTEPGPFRPRTIELGTYLGIRHDGKLVAMAGERLHPPGWREISAVCTDERYRGRGLASRLVRAVVAGIGRRGEGAFLHAAASNTTAIRLYERLGFRLRQRTTFIGCRTPA